MEVGVHMGYQNLRGESDMEFFRKETQLMVEAEAMGFDFAACVEHHFTDYAACPDPAVALSYVAARTSKIKLMPAAFILPWNDPLRIVEKMSMLDSLSEGRAVLGMGRGAARREFRSFGRELADSREIYDEAAIIIMEGLKTGIVKADTKWFQIPETIIRPRPENWDNDRMVMVAMSGGSVNVAAEYGLKTLRFSQGDWAKALPEIDGYREDFRKAHGKKAPPFIISDFMLTFEDPKKVVEYTDKYFGAQFQQVAEHYEFMSPHFKELPSYSTYAYMGDAAKAAGGAHNAYKDYIGGNLIGTPEELYEKHLQRKEMVGDYEIIANFSYGGMPYEDIYEQMKLFADKIMPKLKAETFDDEEVPAE